MTGTTAVGGNDGHVGDDHHRFVVHGNLSAKAGDVDAGDTLTYSVDIKGGDKNLETASTGGNVVTDADGKNVSVPVEVLSGTTGKRYPDHCDELRDIHPEYGNRRIYVRTEYG